MAAAASTVPVPAGARMRILIIEDERDLTDVLAYNLQREGYETLAAHDAVAQPLIRGAVFIGGWRRRSEPALVNSAPVKAVSIEIIRIQFEPFARLSDRH